MELSAAQIRAARALLDWSQHQLADKVGLHINALIRWERGTSRPHFKNNQRMLALFSEMGIEPLPGDGVSRSNAMWKIRTFEGVGFLRDVLEDVIANVGYKGEHLIVSLDEDVFFRNEVATIKKYYASQKKLQFREKIIVPPSNKRFLSNKTIYRLMSEEQLGKISWGTYGNRVVLYNLEARQSLIIESNAYAQTQRRYFETLWSKAKPMR